MKKYNLKIFELNYKCYGLNDVAHDRLLYELKECGLISETTGIVRKTELKNLEYKTIHSNGKVFLVRISSYETSKRKDKK